MATMSDKKFVILRGIKDGNVFFSTHRGEDPTKSDKGETWYEILGYADTVEEAQVFIAKYNLEKYGDPDYPLKEYVVDLMFRRHNSD
jgi:hypothetical protein